MELLTVQETAQKLKTNKNVVYGLINNGHIIALKLGALKITDKELDRFIESAVGMDFSDLKNVKKLER